MALLFKKTSGSVVITILKESKSTEEVVIINPAIILPWKWPHSNYYTGAELHALAGTST